MIGYKHIIVLEIFALSCTFMNMFTDTDTHHKLARGSYHAMRYLRPNERGRFWERVVEMMLLDSPFSKGRAGFAVV